MILDPRIAFLPCRLPFTPKVLIVGASGPAGLTASRQARLLCAKVSCGILVIVELRSRGILHLWLDMGQATGQRQGCIWVRL